MKDVLGLILPKFRWQGKDIYDKNTVVQTLLEWKNDGSNTFLWKIEGAKTFSDEKFQNSQIMLR